MAIILVVLLSSCRHCERCWKVYTHKGTEVGRDDMGMVCNPYLKEIRHEREVDGTVIITTECRP